jgi:hypothetical protein
VHVSKILINLPFLVNNLEIIFNRKFILEIKFFLLLFFPWKINQFFVQNFTSICINYKRLSEFKIVLPS